MSSAADLLRIAGHFARARGMFTRLHGPGLIAYRNRRVRRIVRFAARHAPFYAQHWNGFDRNDWEHLPTVDKPAMMAHFGDFNTARIEGEKAMTAALRAEQSRDFTPEVGNGLTVGLSSGTSGHRGLFLVSRAETAAWAGTVLARTLPGIPPHGYRVALFLRSNSNLYERLGASRRVVFRWFDLMTNLEDAIAALNEFMPRLLVGPPSLLLFLAAAQNRGRLCIHPDRLFSVAEVLEPQDGKALEAAFGVPVGQIYQCTEGLLGVSCPQGSMHVQEDLVALQYEPLDSTNPLRVTPIITDLWRRTQPIIRYRLGDVLRLTPPDAAPCRCGSTFQRIEAIEGRSDDVCYFATNAKPSTLRPFFPDTIRRMILLTEAPIYNYAAEQERPGHLRIFLETDSVASLEKVAKAVTESAERILAQYGCDWTILEVEQGVPIAPPGVKRRRVRCLHKERP